MNKSAPLHRLLAVFLSLFVFAELAYADLVRSGGRGVRALQYSEAVYYVNNQYTNYAGVADSAINSPFELYTISQNGVRTGGAPGVQAVPDYCINGYSTFDYEAVQEELGYLLDDLNDGRITESEYDALVAEQNAIIADEPCTWEFQEGEDLFVWGTFGIYIDNPEIDYDVSWSITGNGNNWSGLTGYINEQQNLQDPSNPSEDIPYHGVMLDIPAPAGLVPGDYSLSVSVTMSSHLGQFFYESSEPGDEVRVDDVCRLNPDFDVWQSQEQVIYNTTISAYNAWLVDNPNPGQNSPDYADWLAAGDVIYAPYDQWVIDNPAPESDICGYNSVRDISQPVYGDLTDPYLEIVSAPTVFTSATEFLRIIPSSLQLPVINANAPTSLGIFALGLVLVWCRKRK